MSAVTSYTVSMKPRTQASLDLALYILFFIPGIAALMYAGVDFAAISWKINEHSTVTADGPPIYQFKAVIPIAGTLLMIQGIAEIVRCVVCLRTGAWPERLKDVEEIDVVETQLAHSEFVDEESRRDAIGKAQGDRRRRPTPRRDGEARRARASARGRRAKKP